MTRDIFILSLVGALAAAAQIVDRGSPCGVNEVSTSCYNDCQETCLTRIVGIGKSCTLACTRTGCVCKRNYLRHDNGTCVPGEECSPPRCQANAAYTKCGSACPTTCQNRGNNCTSCLAVCEPGCFCNKGYVEADDGSCVLPQNCPLRTCSDPNEVFDDCPPYCPPGDKCSNLWSKYDCTKFVQCCSPECRCKSGYYRSNQGKCITTQECIQTNGAGSDATAVLQDTGADATDSD